LADADIVNMVNLRFASEYYHRAPEEVIRLRAGGHNYAYIHDQYHRFHSAQPSARPEDRPVHHFGDHRDDRRDDRRDDHRDNGY
jgi:hypothetical protein